MSRERERKKDLEFLQCGGEMSDGARISTESVLHSLGERDLHALWRNAQSMNREL